MNSYLILSIVTVLSGAVVMGMKICFASKCESVTLCCGVIKVERDVSIEEKEFSNDQKIENSLEITQMKNGLPKV
jgi:hypothetical protein